MIAAAPLFISAPPTTQLYTLFPTRRSSDLARAARRGAPRPGLDGRRGDGGGRLRGRGHVALRQRPRAADGVRDRKSTRLNSSHLGISYAVFCLKKKNNANNGSLVDIKEST